jgi:hypothetical protein
MQDQAYQSNGGGLLDELTDFFAAQVQTQVAINSTLQELNRTLADNGMLTAPLPHLSQSAFLLLNRLALVRMYLLDIKGGAKQDCENPVQLDELRKLVTEPPLPGLPPQLMSGVAHLFSADPLNGNLHNKTYHDQELRDAVRDQLVGLTRLEQTVMRYVRDDAHATDHHDRLGEKR